MFARVNAEGGVRIFFMIQSVVVVIAYGILFAREIAMIVCFFTIVIVWTFIAAAGTVVFTADIVVAAKKSDALLLSVATGEMTVQEGRRERRQYLLSEGPKFLILLIKQWIRLSEAVIWK